MNAQEWVEIPILIHGIAPDREARDHNKEYQEIIVRVNKHLNKNQQFDWEQAIKIEWGWDSPQAKEIEPFLVNKAVSKQRMLPPPMDRYLAQVESRVQNKVANAEKGKGRTLNPVLAVFRLLSARIRELFLYGAPDLFYYISADGEKAIREHVSICVDQEISKHLKQPKDCVSLTIFAHSAGSIIAHDLLFHLFVDPKSASNHYGKSDLEKLPDVTKKLRQLVIEKKLRLRRLYTFGSPITPLMFRSDSLIRKVIESEKINPADIGFRQDDNISGPRWINFWTKDDMAAYPVSFWYSDAGSLIMDQYIDVGGEPHNVFDRVIGSFKNLNPPNVHNAYWYSDRMATYIAENW